MADNNSSGGYMLLGGINEGNAFTCGKCEKERRLKRNEKNEK